MRGTLIQEYDLLRREGKMSMSGEQMKKNNNNLSADQEWRHTRVGWRNPGYWSLGTTYSYAETPGSKPRGKPRYGAT